MTVPPLDTGTGYLPPGEHVVTWDEVVIAYGYNPHRRALLTGLRAAVDDLVTARCARVYLNGSFVTAKVTPGDFDLCFDPAGVDFGLLDPIILATGRFRHILQQAKYGGDLLPSSDIADLLGTTYVDFFQRDVTGTFKGILILNLGGHL